MLFFLFSLLMPLCFFFHTFDGLIKNAWLLFFYFLAPFLFLPCQLLYNIFLVLYLLCRYLQLSQGILQLFFLFLFLGFLFLNLFFCYFMFGLSYFCFDFHGFFLQSLFSCFYLLGRLLSLLLSLGHENRSYVA